MKLSKQDYLDLLQNSQNNIGTLYYSLGESFEYNGNTAELADNILQVIHYMQKVVNNLEDMQEEVV